MNNIIFKKLGTIVLALLIGASVFSLFPAVTKAETTNVTWSDGSLTKTIPEWNQTDIANVGKSSGKWYWEVTLNKGSGDIGVANSDKKNKSGTLVIMETVMVLRANLLAQEIIITGPFIQ